MINLSTELCFKAELRNEITNAGRKKEHFFFFFFTFICLFLLNGGSDCVFVC